MVLLFDTVYLNMQQNTFFARLGTSDVLNDAQQESRGIRVPKQ